jgi:anti-sigma regulatory factor (Ser/Thr protein kinase)
VTSRVSRQNPEIRAFILHTIEDNPDTVGSLTAKRFGISRTTVANYMKRLEREGIITAQGKTTARTYQLCVLAEDCFTIELSQGLSEDAVWQHRVLPLLASVPENIVALCNYGFTEILNNAIDHSGSATADIYIRRTYANITMSIEDHGIGIFERIQRDHKLDDARSALLELSKGKLTSDPERHAGEGIYFTSRMFDTFRILSGKLFYVRSRQIDDGWLIDTEDRKEYHSGTRVSMEISTAATWSPRDVFEKYQDDDLRFRKTHVPLSLGNYPGEQLVSRSQAKRVLARFDRFTEVLLDFKGVDYIGQAFADEIFRIFKNNHPEIHIAVMNASDDIQKMIGYVQANAPERQTTTSPIVS